MPSPFQSMLVQSALAKMKVEELANPSTSSSRVSAHSHIKGLGLDAKTGEAVNNMAGLVGQADARESAGIIVDLVRDRKMAGRAVLFAGPPGTGKTAISLAMAAELGSNVPFVSLVASEVYSAEVKKTSVLMENFRRAIALRVKETKEVYEGEVTEITPMEIDNPLGGYGKTVSHVLLTLKSTKGSKQLRLDATIHEAIVKQHIDVGDIVYVEANSGSIKRLGRCDAYSTEFDLEADEFVPLPKGDVHKRKEVVQFVTLHDLDMANAKPENDKSDIQSLMNSVKRPKKTEITERLRSEINKVVDGYIEDGIAELHPGVLFIDEAHMLDMDCFTFLHRALESCNAPIVVLATNRGVCTINGSDGVRSPHGIPHDLLDRLLIIPTTLYSDDEIAQIIGMRAQAENVHLEDAAMQRLSKIGTETSLRYTVQLLSPALLIARMSSRETVNVIDVDRCRAMFMDAKSSAIAAKQDEEGNEVKNME